MAMSETEFLKKFFNIHRLHDMQDNDYERWVQFEEFINKDNLTDNMKKWAKLLEKDPADNTKYLREPAPDGFFKIQAYPNIDDLSDEDLKRLFVSCQSAFDGLHKNRDAYADTAVIYNFINHYYDIFSIKRATMQANKQTEDEIATLKTFLETLLTMQGDGRTSPEVRTDINAITYKIESVIRNTSEFRMLGLKGFIEKLNDKDYNKNDKFQELVQNVAKLFNRKIADNIDTDLTNLEKKSPALSSQINKLKINNIFGYGSWVETNVDDLVLQKFKGSYSEIFSILYKEQKVLDAFKQYEGGEKTISAAIEKTKADMDYANQESKDFVPRKREEQLTLPQQIKKWTSDTYEGYFAKYKKFQGDRIFMDEASGEICKALDKAKIQPTDGLAKIIENEQAIKTSVARHVGAREAFDWFISALKELQADSKTAKAFEGALRNGRQMKSLVREMIIMAAEADDPKKTKQAKVALEVLSVIKYGNTTSKVMDAIKGDKELFTLMSNKDLSWNKNEGIQFITKAMDKTVRSAFIGAGFGATMLVNTIRKSGSKFNQKFGKGETANRMREASKDWDSEHDAKKAELENQKSNAETAKKEQEAKRNATGIIDDAGLALKEKALRNAKEHQSKLEAAVAPTNAKIETYQAMISLIETYKFYEGQKSSTTDPEISNQLSKKQADILAQFEQYKYELEELGFSVGTGFDITALETRLTTEIQNLANDRNYRRYLSALNRVSDRVYKNQEAIYDYKKATAEIEALNTTIKKDQDKIDKWDENHKNIYDELMAYWDFLETGRDSHTGPLYSRSWGKAKDKQKPMRADALRRFAEFRNGYQAA